MTLTPPKIKPKTINHPIVSLAGRGILKKWWEMFAVQNLPIGRPNLDDGTNRKKITPIKNQAEYVKYFLSK